MKKQAFLKTLLVIFILSVSSMFLITFFLEIYFHKITASLDLSTKYDETKNLPLHFYDGEGEIREEVSLVSINDVSEYLINAILAAEDIDYFKRGKSSPKDCLTLPFTAHIKYTRYLLFEDSFRSNDGASLLKFLIRNYQRSSDNYKPEEYITNYIDECFMITYLDNNFRKDQLLELYFNEIYFLSDQPGLTYATVELFNIEVNDLSLAQAVILAGLPQAPDLYSPINNKTMERADYVLEKMFEEDMISKEEYTTASRELEGFLFE